MMPHDHTPRPASPVRRASWLYAVIVMVIGIFGIRAFYIQVIRHDYYAQAAMSSQLKEYEIPATRGIIKAHEGEQILPLVLNEKRYTLYADPALVKNVEKTAATIADALNRKVGEVQKQLQAPNTRYVVLARKVTDKQKEDILKHKHPGVGAQEQYYRTYPSGSLAAQLLGFVNTEGKGVYGIEQALDEQLQGRAGRLKAITDVHGVPLPASRENTHIEPVAGDDVVLTIDMALQKRLETMLKNGLERAKSDSGSALIIDPHTGAVKAMANWPTYSPAQYDKVQNSSVFNNAAVSDPLEVGSIMKPLTAAAALDLGQVQRNTSYYDPAEWKIDGFKITNIEEDGGAAQQDVQSILRMSLNTGATWLLMQMDERNNEISAKERQKWHDYMKNHYLLGRQTGIEQGFEAEGYIPDPNEGFGLDLTYANTSFGQGMTATMTQMAGAYAAIINGGTYYQPRLIDQTVNAKGEVAKKDPIVLKERVVSPEVSRDMRDLLEGVVRDRASIAKPFNHDLYSVGGKTGTAEIARPEGGYFKDQFNGTYAGFVGGDRPEYVIVVRANKPRIWGYAGSQAAQPIFVDLAHMLIDDFGVTPRSR